jgi:hypothetical protein
MIIARNSRNARVCLKNWKSDVYKECVVDFERGKCGDQTYLNNWPDDYSFVAVSRNIGACVAPWNLNNYVVGELGNSLQVNGVPLIFFHFHGIECSRFLRKFLIFLPASGYIFERRGYLLIYKNYVSLLLDTMKYTVSGLRIVPIKTLLRHTFSMNPVNRQSLILRPIK